MLFTVNGNQHECACQDDEDSDYNPGDPDALHICEIEVRLTHETDPDKVALLQQIVRLWECVSSLEHNEFHIARAGKMVRTTRAMVSEVERRRLT